MCIKNDYKDDKMVS